MRFDLTGMLLSPHPSFVHFNQIRWKISQYASSESYVYSSDIIAMFLSVNVLLTMATARLL